MPTAPTNCSHDHHSTCHHPWDYNLTGCRDIDKGAQLARLIWALIWIAISVLAQIGVWRSTCFPGQSDTGGFWVVVRLNRYYRILVLPFKVIVPLVSSSKHAAALNRSLLLRGQSLSYFVISGHLCNVNFKDWPDSAPEYGVWVTLVSHCADFVPEPILTPMGLRACSSDCADVGRPAYHHGAHARDSRAYGFDSHERMCSRTGVVLPILAPIKPCQCTHVHSVGNHHRVWRSIVFSGDAPGGIQEQRCCCCCWR